MRWSRLRGDLRQLIDGLGLAAIVADPRGKITHRSPALAEILASQSDTALDDALRLAAERVAPSNGGGATPESDGGAMTWSVKAGASRFRLRAVHLPVGADGRAQATVILVEALYAPPLSPMDLQEAFALTRMEAEVAMLLARGHRNGEVATLLHISPHTARRHTERVLQKLGVRSRAEIAGRLNS
jgi:DNA-binding CsgD family transcriptional regulator